MSGRSSLATGWTAPPAHINTPCYYHNSQLASIITKNTERETLRAGKGHAPYNTSTEKRENTLSRKNKSSMDNNITPEPFEEQPQDAEIFQDDREVLETLDVHPMTHTAASTVFEDEDRQHEAGKRDVELYILTYNTLMRS